MKNSPNSLDMIDKTITNHYTQYRILITEGILAMRLISSYCFYFSLVTLLQLNSLNAFDWETIPKDNATDFNFVFDQQLIREGCNPESLSSYIDPMELKNTLNERLLSFGALNQEIEHLTEERSYTDIDYPDFIDSMLLFHLDPIILKHLTMIEFGENYAGGCFTEVKKAIPTFLDLLKKEQSSITSKEFKQIDTDPFYNKNGDQIFDSLITHNQFIILGETHHTINSKKFIIDNMNKLKEHNAILGLEHLPRYPYQQLLDQYIASPDGSPLPPLLAVYLDYLDQGHMIMQRSRLKDTYNFTEIVKKAKEMKVRVVAIDTILSYQFDIQDKQDSKNRYLAMNFMAKNILEREMNDHQKVVLFVGSAHLHTRLKVPGLSEIFDHAPTMVINDLLDSTLKSNESLETLEFNVERGDKDIITNILLNRIISDEY